MSTNKLMALIGNILNTINLALGIISLAFISYLAAAIGSADGKNLSGVTDSTYTYTYANGAHYLSTGAWLFFTIYLIMLLITAAALVFGWIAGAKIDKEGVNDKPWKIFLLVFGILSVFNMFAGVFYILAFALRTPKKTSVAHASGIEPSHAADWTELKPTENSEN
ncbi:MAG: hypothetical protein LBI11_06415 [Streptococcaceae bacterium]|nr:hypothetical protein [Streptococcaceae bacterium]